MKLRRERQLATQRVRNHVEPLVVELRVGGGRHVGDLVEHAKKLVYLARRIVARQRRRRWRRRVFQLRAVGGRCALFVDRRLARRSERRRRLLHARNKRCERASQPLDTFLQSPPTRCAPTAVAAAHLELIAACAQLVALTLLASDSRLNGAPLLPIQFDKVGDALVFAFDRHQLMFEPAFGSAQCGILLLELVVPVLQLKKQQSTFEKCGESFALSATLFNLCVIGRNISMPTDRCLTRDSTHDSKAHLLFECEILGDDARHGRFLVMQLREELRIVDAGGANVVELLAGKLRLLFRVGAGFMKASDRRVLK